MSSELRAFIELYEHDTGGWSARGFIPGREGADVVVGCSEPDYSLTECARLVAQELTMRAMEGE